MALTQADFDYVRALVRKQSAILLEAEKVYLAEARLLPLARREGFDGVPALVAGLRNAPPHHGLHVKVVEAMTTNETSFFRDLKPFEALRQVVLPELIRNRAATRCLNFWCAAASTGQEPYSVALILREFFPLLNSWSVRLIASDLSGEVLERARQATYSQLEVNRGLSAALLIKYFRKTGLDWQLRDDVRRMVEFHRINLIDSWPALPALDVILMRNVLIYFDVETKKQILERAGRMLHPDGYLFLGGAETTLNLHDAFERVEFERAGCYRLRRK